MKMAQKAANAKEFHIRESVNYTKRSIKKILDEIGPRASGSPEEWQAQQRMAEDLKQWADTVETEEFIVHRGAFMGFIFVTLVFGLSSAFLYWFHRPLLGLIAGILGFIPMLLEFVMYKQFLDPFFPGYTSHNVIAARKPTGETKRRIILVGHADSAFEWTLNYKLGGTGMKIILVPALLSVVLAIIFNLIKFFMSLSGTDITASPALNVLGIVMTVLMVPALGAAFFYNPRRVVPGANDNLTGCYVAMSVLRELADADIRFEDTEVIAVMSGSEEAGLRGAKAYVKAHLEELKAIETVAVALDTFKDMDSFAVYKRDLSGTVAHDAQVAKLVHDAAANCGRELPYSSVYLGASDGVPFTQAGIKAVGFAAMDPAGPRYYHTRLDTAELLVPEAIQLGLEITLETVCKYAQEGLPD